jgi:DNA-binding LytR/AlgR family response regulator
MIINCIIVDDEQYARKLLAGYIEKIPNLELVKQCRNSFEAMQALQESKIDLMFLDIQMPDLTGVEFLKTLKHKPIVIFTSAYHEYALEGYELDVIDYMLKPISFERFMQGVNKAIELVYLKNSQNNGINDAASSDLSKQATGFIYLKADYKSYKIKYNDILFIEGLKEYVTYYTKERKYIVLKSLKNLEKTLPQNQFKRVHKSYIVNTDNIDSFYGNTIEIGDKEIPIGKSFADDVKRFLFKA